ncbi:MAG: DUF1566 domain-containing protein [Syntrophales bacterium]
MMKVAKTWVLVFLLLISAIDVHAWPVPDTGQTKCTTASVEITCPTTGQPFYGQDGNYTINPPSYTKLDATDAVLPDSATSWVMVRDNVTGLIWENRSGGSATYTWCDRNAATNGGNQGTCGTGTGAAATDTAAYIKAMNDAKFGSFSDWRMPTLMELATILNLSYYSLLINTAWFPYTLSSDYWSSTTNGPIMANAWYVDFRNGSLSNASKVSYNSKAVRAVRGGQSEAPGNFVNNANGTVSDTATGLMWQQETVREIDWKTALAYAEGLSLAGYDDWRLPTITELQTIVDYRHRAPAIDTTFFPDTLSSIYLSSTPYALAGGDYYAWTFDFSDGSSSGRKRDKWTASAARVVRGGQSASSFVSASAGSNQVVFNKATLDGSASQGNITSWNWTLTHRTNPAYSRTATGQMPSLENLVAGFYDVSLTVSDGTSTSAATNLLAVAGIWDVDGDGKLGLAEAIYILQTTAGVR